jgi:hypothetical protein
MSEKKLNKRFDEFERETTDKICTVVTLVNQGLDLLSELIPPAAHPQLIAAKGLAVIGETACVVYYSRKALIGSPKKKESLTEFSYASPWLE